MTTAHKKLLREYGDPHNNMAAKEFRRDLARLVREVREECAGAAELQLPKRSDIDAYVSKRQLVEFIAAAIRSKK
jgi:hypothetical protein